MGNNYKNKRYCLLRPNKIWVEKILVEKDKSFHIWGKIIESEKLYSFWAPKSQLIPNAKEEVEIEYTSFSNRPPLEHQKEAIKKLVNNKKFILADDMGLGKTTSASNCVYNL